MYFHIPHDIFDAAAESDTMLQGSESVVSCVKCNAYLFTF